MKWKMKCFIGIEFANRDLAKDLIRAYAVESRRNLHFLINDPRRIRVVCNGVVPSKNVISDKVQGPNVDNAVNSKIVNEDAEEDKTTYLIIMNPSMPIKAIQEQMQKKFHVAISKDKAFRAKAKAAVSLRGDVKIQYALLRDYVCELKRCNPYTNVKIDVYGEEDPDYPTRLFRRIYVCLGALKRGFREGVGVDANNGIYPVAYGIVESENQYSWTWFLKCLGDDFDLYSNSNFTFITDRQKGLLPALEKLFPHAEHMYCCASSTTTVLFEKNMQELKYFNKKAYEWLKKIPAKHWSRAYFSGRAHCDLLINNICEVFNRQLLDARDSPIITALEHGLLPALEKLLRKLPVSVLWIGMVLINTRKWEISGIPCKHAIAAIHDMADNGNDVGIPEDWVHDSYKLATWKAVYSHKVNPVNGRELWSKFDCPTTLLPPKIHPQIGRPPKKRKKSKGEIVMVKGNKLTRQGKTVTCSLCHAAGHNKRSCDRRQPSQGGTSNATKTKRKITSKVVAAEVRTQASQASKGGTSNAGTQASTGSPLKRTKKSASRLTPEK
ncbi:mutator type transposase [Tanacetum coccineum]